MSAATIDPEKIKRQVDQWLDEDVQDDTRAEIQHLWSNRDLAELDRRLSSRIAFGTAGLRARMEAGYSRMNCLTVIQASQGLARYVLEHVSDAANKGIVIGYDARRKSEKFAKFAKAVFEHASFKVYCAAMPVHTPLVPFSVKYYGAAAGIMITASHNPKDDNGYKVYWENGAQINTPRDAGIAESINRNLKPWPNVWDAPEIDENSKREDAALAMSPYMEAVESLLQVYLPKYNLSLPAFVYTPLHGVGSKYINAALSKCFGTSDGQILQVPEQADMDPEFPTVQFPNPEEAGALDLAFKEADKHGITLVIANDPDADRFSAAEKDVRSGQWAMFTGNEVGILLAQFLKESPKLRDAKEKKEIALMNTVVSTKMLEAMAVKDGFKYHQTLTGFKWMGNEAQRLEQEGFTVPFAFEEALGYMFPNVVYDKDGVAAATMFLAAYAKWQEEEPDVSLRARYKRISDGYGYYADANSYLKRQSPEVTNRIFQDIRGLDGGSRPCKLISRNILRWIDLTEGFDSKQADHKPILPIDKSSQMIMFVLEAPREDAGEVHVTIRGSGTEPKIKIYVEASSLIGFDQALQDATAVREDIISSWMDPHKYGLKRPGES